MRNIKAILLCAVLALPAPAYAQSTVSQARVVPSCSSQNYTAGQNAPTTQDTSGNTCINDAGGGGGSVTANQGTPNAGGATNSWPVQGAGTAGTPAGGVVSIQGVASGTTIPTTTSPGARTIVALDISTVTTGGTAVTALNAGHRTAGGFLTNPKGATIDLCINEQGAASGTTSSGALTCIPPGGNYNLVPAAGAVSVITSDSSHPFSGEGLN
jgi:hypothetical protein